MIEINDDNFNEYFFDIKTNKPQKEQIIACFKTCAELIDGFEKKQIIQLLRRTNSSQAIIQIMKNILYANNESCYLVPIQIAKDLIEGKTEEEILEKPYKMILEKYYYVEEQYIPDSPHWIKIKINNMEQYIEKSGEVIKISSKIIND
jgi:hypothetical protein